MSDRKILFLFVLFSFIPFFSHSQQSDSAKFAERNNMFMNYENYRSSITDTSVEILKRLNNLQTELIILDNSIFHNFISTNNRKVEELQGKCKVLENEKQIAVNNYVALKRWMFYGLIGAGIFILLSVLFIVLYILTNNKKKKTFNQLIKIEKIKEEQLKEIGLLKNEIASLSITDKIEISKVKEELKYDFTSLKNKYDIAIKEKELLENKIKDNEIAINELNEKQKLLLNENSEEKINLKNHYENQVYQLNSELVQLKHFNQLMNEKIQENAGVVNNMSNQIDTLNSQQAELKEFIETKELQNKLLEEKLLLAEDAKNSQNGPDVSEIEQLKSEKSNLENELNSIKNELNMEKLKNQEMLINQEKDNMVANNNELSKSMEENNLLRTELFRYKEQLKKEAQLRNEIENEIKQLIEEIKGSR